MQTQDLTSVGKNSVTPICPNLSPASSPPAITLQMADFL